MPPLTITSAELHRIVHALDRRARRGRHVVTPMTRRRLESSGAAPGDARHRARCAHRDLDADGPGHSLPTAVPVVSFASNDYLGLTQHPAVVAAAHAALDRWGTGSGVGPAHRRLAPGAPRARARARRRGSSADRAVLFPTGFAANLGVLTTFGGPDVLVCSDELNHASIIDGCRLAGRAARGVPPRDVAHLDALLRDARRAAVPSSSPTRCSRWTATSHRSTSSSRCARATARSSCSTRPTRSSAPISGAASADVDVLRVGTLSKTLGALGGFVAGPGASPTSREPGPLRTSSPPRRRPPTRPPRSRRSGRASPEGDELVALLARNVDRLRPGHPSPILPVRVRERGRRAGGGRRAARTGVCSSPRSARRPCRRDSRLRVTLSAAHTDEQVDRLASALASRSLP